MRVRGGVGVLVTNLPYPHVRGGVCVRGGVGVVVTNLPYRHAELVRGIFSAESPSVR